MRSIARATCSRRRSRSGRVHFAIKPIVRLVRWSARAGGVFALGFGVVILGKQHVHRRQHEQREQRAERHAGHDHQADAVARRGACAGHQASAESDRTPSQRWSSSTGRKRVAAASRTASSLREPAPLQLVGELDDQDAVLRHQPDQRDQADLRVDVERRGPAVGPKRRCSGSASSTR